MTEAKALISTLGLTAHPEGGWYRETWRSDVEHDGRSSATLIHFLLEADQYSHWHAVDAAEIWLWHLGNPLDLSISAPDSRAIETVTLGHDINRGQRVQHVIPSGYWQAARPSKGEFNFTLVSCVVSPGFEFSGFTLAPAGWEPGT